MKILIFWFHLFVVLLIMTIHIFLKFFYLCFLIYLEAYKIDFACMSSFLPTSPSGGNIIYLCIIHFFGKFLHHSICHIQLWSCRPLFIWCSRKLCWCVCQIMYQFPNKMLCYGIICFLVYVNSYLWMFNFFFFDCTFI